MDLTLDILVADFASGIQRADARGPCALNRRSKVPFQPGIGPHDEAETVRLTLAEMAGFVPAYYSDHQFNVPYPSGGRQACDLCLGHPPEWDWSIEAKLLRFLGDNGKPNDNILMHILSPYPQHRSALTDCEKLVTSGLSGRKAILIFGYDHAEWSMGPALDAFEALASRKVNLGPRHAAEFRNLVHPVHSQGRVVAWEVEAR